jgi:hypothetical protein
MAGLAVIGAFLQDRELGVRMVAERGQSTDVTIRPLARVSKGVTYAGYWAVDKGMTYERVCGIIGTEGIEISRSEIAGYTTIMYVWKNRDGSNMNAMFQDGGLVSKAQFGLH